MPGRENKEETGMKYKVSYSEHVLRDIDVEADCAEEAERMVLDGEVDYDQSVEVDAEVTCVNSSELIESNDTTVC
jgi:hypothetical protein